MGALLLICRHVRFCAAGRWACQKLLEPNEAAPVTTVDPVSLQLDLVSGLIAAEQAVASRQALTLEGGRSSA